MHRWYLLASLTILALLFTGCVFDSTALDQLRAGQAANNQLGVLERRPGLIGRGLELNGLVNGHSHVGRPVA